MVLKRESIKRLLLFLIGIFCQTNAMMSRGIMIIYLGFCTLLFLMSINIKKIKLGKGLIWYGLFSLYCMITLSYTINTINPDYVYIRMLTYLYLIFLASPFFDEKENIEQLIKGFIIGGFIGISVVIIKQYNYIGVRRLGSGVYGSFASYGNVCMLTLACLIWIKDKMFKSRLVRTILLIFAGVAVILSGARKAILVSILIWIFLNIFDKRKKLAKKTLFLSIACVFILVFVYMSLNNDALYKMVGYRIETGISSILGKDETDASLEERSSLKRLAVEMAKEKPIYGWGIHSFAYKNYLRGNTLVFSHDSYLEILSCYGLIGFILYYYVFAYILFNHKVSLKDDVTLFLYSYVVVILIMEPYSISFLNSGPVLIVASAAQLIHQKNKELKNEKVIAEIV